MTPAITADDLERHMNFEYGSADRSLLAGKIEVATAAVENIIGGPNGAAHATGTITFNSPPVASDTVTINGITFQAIATGPATDTQFLIGTTPEASAANFVAALNAYLENNYGYQIGELWVDVDGAAVTIVAAEMGKGGNAYTLATTSAHVTLSGPTLTGGALPPPPVAEAVRQLAAHLFENREASIVGVTASEIPFGVFDLLTPYRAWGF